MTDIVPIKRALLSVSDKSGLIELAKSLTEIGIELLSTGGTFKAISDAGLPVTPVEEVTGFPEMMDGRVKTLHPNVHGGLLARRDLDTHLDAATRHGIGLIDLLVVNLYPFEQTVARGADYDTTVENIDIGGPAMVRAAAKNHASVAVVTDVNDYDALVSELSDKNGLSKATCQRLAQKAYSHTAAYDAAISTWMAEAINVETPAVIATGARLKQTMRYGENPHQSAAFYTQFDAGHGIATARQLQGKELSYNNINDTDAAFSLVSEFDPSNGPACAIIKHANPCGVATGASLDEAYSNAFDCDRTSAFGGIIALNQPLDAATAQKITEIFTEVVIAPGASDEAIAVFEAKKNLRLLLTEGLADPSKAGKHWRQVSGGYLLQDADTKPLDTSNLKTVTKRAPSDQEMADLMFAWTVAKHVKSNAIIYAKDGMTVGIGAGQMSRIDSTRIAAWKAKDAAEVLELDQPKTNGSVVASDAFFPFQDGLLAAAEAGATAIIQPGGAMRDDDVIAAADDAGLAMVFTGMRHFRH